MSKIVIRFASHPGIFNALCRFAQYRFWATHCEAVLPDGRRLGSWFHRGGVRILPPDYDDGLFTRELFVTLKATDEQEKAFYDFLYAQVGKPYDWRSIVSFYIKFGRDWQADDSWFCDELMAAGTVTCGLFPKEMARETHRITVFGFFLLASMITEGG